MAATTAHRGVARGMTEDADELRRSRRFTSIVLAVVVLGMLGTSALAVFVDPLNTFGTGRIPSILTGERDEKPAAFLALEPPPQAIVLGSSRIMKIRPSCLAELTGLPAYNFGLSDALIEDMSAVLKFIQAKGRAPLRVILIGLDARTFDDHAEVDPRLLSSAVLGGYLDQTTGLSWRTVTRALFGKQGLRYGLISLYFHLRPHARPPQKAHFEPDGVVAFDQWDPALAAGTLDSPGMLARNVERFRGPLSSARFSALSPTRLALFRSLVTAAHNSGTVIHVFLPPLQPAIEEVLASRPIARRTEELALEMRALERAGLIVYHPITKVEDFGGDPDGYYDGIHMTDVNSRRLLLWLFQRDHGCGI
ncbi:MAG: hypothetical protein IPQ07_09445 [Myxococcales bacterium]|nr:hypothetical protein [Myxococcales bacterium]